MKRQIVRQFLVERASFIVDLIECMLCANSGTKRPDTVKRGPAGEEEEVERIMKAECEKITELTELENAMNKNEALRPTCALAAKFPGIDTRVVSCLFCAKRLIKFGEGIHYHEYHSEGITINLDTEVSACTKLEGSL